MAGTIQEDPIVLEINDKIALITINMPKNANALTPTHYAMIAAHLRSIDQDPNILITVLTGKGRFLSAGADVRGNFGANKEDGSARVSFIKRFASGALDLGRELYTHSKILVCALNGPAIGLAAGLLGHFDFIYAQEGAYILTPFTSLGLIAEGGSSQSFVQRMGLGKAMEVLVLGKSASAKDLLACGFVNRVFPQSPEFLQEVLKMLKDDYNNLDSNAVLLMKRMIRDALPNPDTANLREIMGAIARFETGIPQKNFARVASKL